MNDELWCGQAQNEVNFDFQVKSDLEGQGRSLHKIKRILTNLFYTYERNFVILARTGHELSRGQVIDIHTDRHVDAGNDNTRWLKLAWGNKLILQ